MNKLKRHLQKKKPTKRPVHAAALNVVAPNPDENKSGCYWCSLFPFTNAYTGKEDDYKRDGTKILAKEVDGHSITHMNIQEKWTKVDILFVGEAPGGNEDKKGQAFVGRSGKLLREAAEKLIDLPEEKVGITNIVRCRPPRNRDPRKTELQSCGYELVREIKAREPKLVVVLGNHSMNFLTGQTGITTLAGHFMQSVHPDLLDIPVLACLHPAYILRFDFNMEKFCETLALADSYLKGEYEPPKGEGEYYVLDNLKDVKALFDEMVQAGEPVAFDTETGSYTPFQSVFPSLLCYSFSNEEGVGYTIPFDHGESPWRPEGGVAKERVKLKKMLRDFFLSGTPLVAQNEKFDRQHIKAALGFDLPVPLRDTMTTHMVLDETRGTHGLKRLSYIYTGMGGYERPLEQHIAKHKEANPDKGGSYANIPGAFLFKYAAMDADVTKRVDVAMTNTKEYKENVKFRNMAEKYLPALGAALGDMEYAGAQIDPKVVRVLDAKYLEEMEHYIAEIAKLPKVVQYVTDTLKSGKKLADDKFNPGSPAQLRRVLFDYYGCMPRELTDKGFEILVARHKAANNKNKNSKKIAFDVIVRECLRKKEWDFFSTKADVLYEYERTGNELVPLILKYRAADTLHGTFVKPLLNKLDPSDRIHGSFLIHGTVTGRLASRFPNLMNIPNKGGGLIKQAYISRFGDEGMLVQLDFSQIELRFAACWFNDRSMINAYIDGIDLHTLTAADMHKMSMEQFNKLPADEAKAARRRAKSLNFGCLYGGGPPALQAALRKEGVFVTEEECKEFIDRFFKVRPGLKKGIEKLEDVTREKGYLESFTGRRRRVPEVGSGDEQLVARALRQAINFPIQSGASDMTLMSLVLINLELKARGLKSRLVLTVHDSIIFDCHVDEFLEVAQVAKYIMEHLPELSEQVMPGLDWKWLRVPIVADCEAGVTWGQLVSFNPDVLAEGITTDTPMFVKTEGKQEQVRDPETIDELWDALEYKCEVT